MTQFYPVACTGRWGTTKQQKVASATVSVPTDSFSRSGRGHFAQEYAFSPSRSLNRLEKMTAEFLGLSRVVGIRKRCFRHC